MENVLLTLFEPNNTAATLIERIKKIGGGDEEMTAAQMIKYTSLLPSVNLLL